MGREWGKEGESFHVCFSAAQCWQGTVAEEGSAWSASAIIFRGNAPCLLVSSCIIHVCDIA